MIKPVSKELMIDVKMLANPKKFYKVQRCVNLSISRDNLSTIEGSQRPVVKSMAIGINNMLENIAIILQTLKNKCVINVDPAQQYMEGVQEQLEAVLANLRSKTKNSYDDVIGLVVGGRAYDASNPFAEQGVQLTDKIYNFLTSEKIPSTKILEQKIDSNAKGMSLYSHRNNAILSDGIINEFNFSVTSTPEQIQEAGNKYFEVFEVSPYAPIKVVDEILPDKSTNLRYR